MTIAKRIAKNNSKVDTANKTSTATTYTTKAAKNGAINFYSVETGKRVKEADIVAEAIENGGIFYAASVHGYDVDHVCSKEFASPITAYKWICRMARKSNTYADGDACITVGFCGELIYTQKHSVNEIKNAELRAYVEAEMAEQIAEADNNEREDLIHAQMHNNNLTREQAEQITDYLRANRKNYNAEIAATAKAMLDNYKKINNPETATVNVEINNAAEHTPATVEETADNTVEAATVEEKAEVIIPIVDYRTLLTWAEKVSNGQHDTAIQIVTHIKKWFNAETDKKTVIEVIKAGDLNGFRNFLCQFNFVVKDDGGCIHKLYRYDNGECVLAEIPTSEYAKYSVEETEAELPSGNVTVNSGAEAWAIVGKYFPKGNLEFYRAGKGFNNEDTFCYTLDEIIYVHVTCTPDNKRVKCIEIVNTYEESESERNILTVYINHDAEINTVTDTTPEYKYYIKSRRPIFGAAPNGYIKAVSGEVHEPVRRTNGTYSPKCRIYFATVIYDKPLTDEQILNYDLAVSNETFELLNAPPAQNEMSTISNIAETDGSEDDDFADEMPAPKLSTVKPDSPCAIANGLNGVFQNVVRGISYMDVTTQDGNHIVTRFGNVYIEPDWQSDDGYIFTNSIDTFARYDTPEQVVDAVTALRDAINCGETEFCFPTVEELNTPPTVPAIDRAQIEDSLTLETLEQQDNAYRASGKVFYALNLALRGVPFGAERKQAKKTLDDAFNRFNEKARAFEDSATEIYGKLEERLHKVSAQVKAMVDAAIDRAQIEDSLTRAMNIALEHYKGFCHVGNLTAATNELSLYNICRKAMTELWKEETA